MSNFTPGPWLRDGRTVYALNDSGCNQFYCGVQDAFTSESELLANAQLIAAAPDLLAALKACALICAGESNNKSSLIRALEMARSAIAKATEE